MQKINKIIILLVIISTIASISILPLHSNNKNIIKKYNIKGYCFFTSEGYNCYIYINNTINNNFIYINKINITIGSRNIEIPLFMKGLTALEHEITLIQIKLINNYINITEISFSKNLNLIYKYNSMSNTIKDLNQSITTVASSDANLTLAPGKGSILPLDFEFNLTNSTGGYSYLICINNTSYIDLKIFSWNDVIYQEYLSNLSSGCYLYPIPGTDNSHGYTISRATLNIINPTINIYTLSVKIALVKVPSCRITIESSGGVDSFMAPLIPRISQTPS